jgi:hypothetical protein
MTLSDTDKAHVAALIADHVPQDDLIAEYQAQRDAIKRAASLASAPPMPVVADDQIDPFAQWLLDGQGTSDVWAEVQLAIVAILSRDTVGGMQHISQVFKNVCTVYSPQVSAFVAQLRAAAAAATSTSTDTTTSTGTTTTT